jgi:L-iditol 2-dehydrogenase
MRSPWNAEFHVRSATSAWKDAITYAQSCASEAAALFFLIFKVHCKKESIILRVGYTSEFARLRSNQLLILVRLPASFRFEDGALLEPLAVACHSVRRAGIKPGSSCLIVGAGAVGLLCAAVARFRVCKQIVISDIDSRRVNFTVQESFAEVGYTSTPKRAGTVDEDLTNGRGLASEIGSQLWTDGSSVGRLNATFECTGVPGCVQASIYVSQSLMPDFAASAADNPYQATRSGGRIMLVGMGTPNYVLPISEASAREIDLVPVWRYAHCYEEAIEEMSMVIDGSFRPDIRKLITHRFEGLENVEKAFQMAGSSQDMTGKIVIKVAVNTETS